MSFDVDVEHCFGEHCIRCAFKSEARLVALVAPSGAGKTTVLNAIAGLFAPDHGRIAVSGDVLFDSATGTNLPPERRHIGYVFQDARLFPHMNVRANLVYGSRFFGRNTDMVSFDHIVDLLDIAHLLDRSTTKLSGGEVRRVAIGRALISCPRALLLDEPLSSIDPARQEKIVLLIERVRDVVGIPILLVTHSAQEVSRLADEVFAIS